MENLSCIPKLIKETIINTWIGETLKLMLLNNLHVPNAGTQLYVSDVVANEIVDVGGIYTAGGVTLVDVVTGFDPDIPNNYFLDAKDVTIGPRSTISYKYGIIYIDKGTGSHTVNPILAQVDFLENQVIVNGRSIIVWNTLGIIYIS